MIEAIKCYRIARNKEEKMLSKRRNLILVLVVLIFLFGCSQPDFNETEWRNQVETVKKELLKFGPEKVERFEIWHRLLMS